MLINPNLYTGPSRFIIKPKNEKWNSYSMYLNDFNLTEGVSYIITLKSEQTNNGPGVIEYGIFEEGVAHPWRLNSLKPGNYEKIEFIYSSKTHRIIFYPGLRGNSENIGANFYKIKLEKEKETLYIPNENTIETAKHQYFVGGVRSKRFIQSSNYPKQSSFRKEVAA